MNYPIDSLTHLVKFRVHLTLNSSSDSLICSFIQQNILSLNEITTSHWRPTAAVAEAATAATVTAVAATAAKQDIFQRLQATPTTTNQIRSLAHRPKHNSFTSQTTQHQQQQRTRWEYETSEQQELDERTRGKWM